MKKKIALFAVFFFVAGLAQGATALGATAQGATALEATSVAPISAASTSTAPVAPESLPSDETFPETTSETSEPAESVEPEPVESIESVESINSVESEDWAPDPDNAIDELMQTLLRSSPKFFDEKAHGLEGNYAVLGVENGNLEKEDRIDRVRLLALRKEDGIYDRALLLEVEPMGDPPFLIRLSEDVKGFDSTIQLKNFASPDKSEILLSVKGVDDTIGRLLVIQVREGEGRVIYDSQTTKLPTIKGRFFNNYRAEIVVQETGARALIDLSSRKANYDRRLVYNESSGTLRTPITVWEDRHSSLQPVDVDGDGVYELKGVIDLVGVTRADRIAYVEFTLQYANGSWWVMDSWVVPVEDLANLPIPRRIN
ncbi:MAG: hypothetical protein LBQ42_02260 [Synergistaceae bacterium]|nr:hypothetical protein [Synergistaceae bacterium]